MCTVVFGLFLLIILLMDVCISSRLFLSIPLLKKCKEESLQYIGSFVYRTFANIVFPQFIDQLTCFILGNEKAKSFKIISFFQLTYLSTYDYLGRNCRS